MFLVVLSACGLFLLCNAAGTILALALLLRFDAMELLTPTPAPKLMIF